MPVRCAPLKAHEWVYNDCEASSNSLSTAPSCSLARFLTLLRATFVEAKESGSDVDAAALEVSHQNSLSTYWL